VGVKAQKMFLYQVNAAGDHVKKGEFGFGKATLVYSDERWIFANHNGTRKSIKGVTDKKEEGYGGTGEEDSNRYRDREDSSYLQTEGPIQGPIR